MAMLFSSSPFPPVRAQLQEQPVKQRQEQQESQPEQAAKEAGNRRRTRYVSDQLEITLRRGAGNKYRILRMLKSGTPLEVLEENRAGYSRVRIASGTTGWVLSRYLQDEPVARERLAENERRMEAMKGAVAEMDALVQKMGRLQEELAKIQGEKEVLEKKLQEIQVTAANVLVLKDENQRLKSQLASSEKRIQALEAENLLLSKGTKQRWFLIGGGVILLGILIGLTIPKIRWKRRRQSMSGGLDIGF